VRGGPIIVVYPEGVWYGGVTPALLERIVVEHLKHGRVVEEAVFYRLEARDQGSGNSEEGSGIRGQGSDNS
jgi:(2Fe-2S) ferredoxin